MEAYPDRDELRRPWLVLMMKAPEAGRVKTRLAAEIGAEAATALYRVLVEHLARRLLAAPERSWRPVVALSPPEAVVAIREWLGPLVPEETFYIAQPEGDLGRRLTAAFERGFDKFAPAVVAIGADCPEIAPSEIEACLEGLRLAPLIMGEAADGGYWTIGMRGRHFEIFDQMPWSTPRLAEATRRRAGELLLPMIELPIKRDIDTRADLEWFGVDRLSRLCSRPNEEVFIGEILRRSLG